MCVCVCEWEQIQWPDEALSALLYSQRTVYWTHLVTLLLLHTHAYFSYIIVWNTDRSNGIVDFSNAYFAHSPVFFFHLAFHTIIHATNCQSLSEPWCVTVCGLCPQYMGTIRYVPKLVVFSHCPVIKYGISIQDIIHCKAELEIHFIKWV